MAESLKVPQAEFEAVIKALLTTKPLPLSDIRRRSEPKAAAAARWKDKPKANPVK